MQLERLVATSAAVAATRSRKTKVRLLAELLEEARPEELETLVAYLMGELPQGKVGVGHAALRRALDIPAAEAATLRMHDVHQRLDQLAEASGAGSARLRAATLAELMGRARPEEQSFLFRLLTGELRQGALQGLMAEAIAQASGLALTTVRRAIMLSGSAPEVARVARVEGALGLARYRIELFRPLLPMLAQTGDHVADVVERLGTCAFEHKLDGARVLVHRQGTRVAVYSRRGNDVTTAVPEVVEAARALPADSLLLDGEAIALGPNGRALPFQVTMRRFGRRLDVDLLRGELPLSVFFFDCLYVDGEELIDRPARERMERLDALVPSEQRVGRALVSDEESGEEFLAEALRAGHEGVVAKQLDAPYEAGRRGAAWLKLKPAHTVDLVVLAAEWGSGRRQGWLSNLHLGARDGRGGFVMLGKTFKGLTDAMLTWQTEALGRLATAEANGVVAVRPELVVEVAFDGLQRSPQYPGGLALRFARVKAHRPDKRPEEADTLETLRRWAPPVSAPP
jgi:DNA ligase-1